MASVSLNTIGTAFSKSGAITLAGTVLDGYTRAFGSHGYTRINPFQVENGNAPPTFTAPHSLTEWEAYLHSTVNSGSQLEITAEGYGELDLAWTLPSGYSRDTANLISKVYWKDMGTSLDLSVNPFDAGSEASAGDGTTYTITGLTDGRFYAIGVKVEWDDSVATHTNVDSLGYNNKAGEPVLTGAGRGIASGEVFDDTIDFTALVQTTDPGTCSIPDVVNLRLSVSMEGPSTGELQEEKNSGGFSTIDSSVTPGSSTINLSRTSGDDWNYRIRYNDVGGGSPGPWSVERNILAECTLP